MDPIVDDPSKTPAPVGKPSTKIPYKLKRFQKLYLTHPEMTPTEIAEKVYDCAKKTTAAVIASQNLKKLNITRQDIFDRMGLSDEEDVKDLARLRKAKKVVSAIITGEDAGAADKDFIEVDDNGTQLKALELTFKVKGAFNDDKAGPGDHITNFLTIVESVNVANITRTDKGITIEQAESANFNKYLAK